MTPTTAQASPTEGRRLTIVMPVLDDWDAAALVLARLSAVFANRDERPEVLLVDDGSAQGPPGAYPQAELPGLASLHVLHLRRNLGHQRALAVAIAWIEAQDGETDLVLMDADGEDRPEDLPRLLERLHEEDAPVVVFAERRRRTESLGFRAGYLAYRWLHRLLTGVSVRVGNFCAVDRRLLPRLAATAELWNHFAAAVFATRVAHRTVPTARGHRLAGSSRMDYAKLVMHGLSAIAVFSEVIAARLLLGFFGLSSLTGVLLVAALVQRRLSDAPFPGWLPIGIGLLLLLLLQASTALGLFAFVTLRDRQAATFLPARDHAWFVDRVSEWTLSR